ncbi:hypothetical protein KM043_010393 [Ampulex compressa]|nr:hypothetical protein KM043_010393 [Ampulex compressa]
MEGAMTILKAVRELRSKTPLERTSVMEILPIARLKKSSAREEKGRFHSIGSKRKVTARCWSHGRRARLGGKEEEHGAEEDEEEAEPPAGFLTASGDLFEDFERKVANVLSGQYHVTAVPCERIASPRRDGRRIGTGRGNHLERRSFPGG